jgi:hypothetical protein
MITSILYKHNSDQIKSPYDFGIVNLIIVWTMICEDRLHFINIGIRDHTEHPVNRSSLPVNDEWLVKLM